MAVSIPWNEFKLLRLERVHVDVDPGVIPRFLMFGGVLARFWKPLGYNCSRILWE